MVSDVRATITRATGETLDLGPDLIDLNTSDSIDAGPRGAITLPLRRVRNGTRERWTDLIRLGDHLTLEMLAWDGTRGDWTTVLHGPVTSINHQEAITRGRYDARVTLNAAGMDHILSRDAVAWWMFYGTIDGYATVRARLTLDELTQAPYRVMYQYLRKVAFHASVYDHNGPLSDYLNLDFAGLEGLSPVAISLSAPEGSHLSAITPYLDAPLHELYTTTKPISALTGTLTTGANGPGSDKALTTVTWRKAPYPFATVDLTGDTSEWEALPLHTVETGLRPVDNAAFTRTDAAVRNFVIAYPAVQFLNEQFAYAYGAAIVNPKSHARFGYAPLKTRTHLIADQEATQSALEEYMYLLTARLAGQWNRQEEMLGGQVSLPLDPTIRPGERFRCYVPWNEDAGLHEFHIRGRNLTWNRSQGGRLALALERGLPVSTYRDAAWFVDGLQKVRVGGEVYAEGFRAQDTPGE